jgi:hypothetical protein
MVLELLCDIKTGKVREVEFDQHAFKESKYSDNPFDHLSTAYGGYSYDVNVCPNDGQQLKTDFGHVSFDDVNTTFKTIWYKPGSNEETPWYWIAKFEVDRHTWHGKAATKTPIYVILVASCDNTGFDCQGSMTFFLSHSLRNLCRYGMDDSCRDAIRRSFGETPIPERLSIDGDPSE